MDMLSSTSNDGGLLSEWAWPGKEWEIITGDEVDKRMQRVSDGTAPGPVSHACPPGVLSGMSEFDAVRLARANGLPALLDRQAARQRLIHAGWDADLTQRILDATDACHTDEMLQAAVIDLLGEIENKRVDRTGRNSQVHNGSSATEVARLLCPFGPELDEVTH